MGPDRGSAVRFLVDCAGPSIHGFAARYGIGSLLPGAAASTAAGRRTFDSRPALVKVVSSSTSCSPLPRGPPSGAGRHESPGLKSLVHKRWPF